jgi:mRNA-degrading endonuclease RelE of RelBE toxin-antitoxin system
MLKQAEFTILLNYGMELMSSNNPKPRIEFTDVFKRQVRDLAKRYRRIKFDIQPVLDQLASGDLVGDKIQNTGYTVFKVRIKNSDIQKGKSGGYRLIYYIKTSENILCVLIYSKSDEENVTSLEIKKIIQNFMINVFSFSYTLRSRK